MLKEWIIKNNIEVLNVAGNRSIDERWVSNVLRKAFGMSEGTGKVVSTKNKIQTKKKQIEEIKRQIAKSEQSIDKLGQGDVIYRSRTRDVKKLPPVELMHIPSYVSYIQEFGKQLPKSSKKSIKLSKKVRLYEAWPRKLKEKMNEENNC